MNDLTKLSDEELLSLRDNTIKLISKYHNFQINKKVLLNSAYGACGNVWFRYYDIRMAEAITLGGQLSIKWIQRKLNDFLNDLLESKNKDYVVASDTDSVYLNMESAVRKIFPNTKNWKTTKVVRALDRLSKEKILPFIEECYQELALQQMGFEQKMNMSREVIADKGIWTAKKRYVLNVLNSEGVSYKEPKMKVVGLEVVRSSTPNVCRDAIKECLKIMLNEDNEHLVNYIEDFKEGWDKLYPADIGKPIGMNGLHKYYDSTTIYGFKTPAHVKGALLFNHHLKEKGLTKKYETIKEGEKVKFVYLKEPNNIQCGVISFIDLLPDEFDLDKYIDYDLQFQKTFLDPLETIAKVIGWNTEHISTLDSFFD